MWTPPQLNSPHVFYQTEEDMSFILVTDALLRGLPCYFSALVPLIKAGHF